MSDHLCISVRWLDSRYHGRVDDGDSAEWPPSPLRLFQALLAGAKRVHWTNQLAESFRWLETASERQPPAMAAPAAQSASPYTLFVPNNDTDRAGDMQRAAKIVRPTILPEECIAHYLWPVSSDERKHAENIVACTKHLTVLGLGIDLAFANGQIINDAAAAMLPGIRWTPLPAHIFSGHPMRTPVAGTLERLELVYASQLSRLADGISHPPLPFRAYNITSYHRSDAQLPRPNIVFKLVDEANKTYSHPHAQLIHVAAWVRHAAIEWTRANPRLRDLAEFVSGHGDRLKSDYRQLSYIPLPSIGHMHTEPDIRRVIVAEPVGSSGEALRRVAAFLHGTLLKPETAASRNGPVIRLVRSQPDGVTRQYLGSSDSWVSVTPVILPGHDDHKPAKTEKLIQKALRQSGIEQPCEFTWSAVPNFKNCLAAYKHDRNGRRIGYFRPGHLQDGTAVHVRLRFKQADGTPIRVAGPLCVGAGRHCGLGVFAVEPS